MGVESGLANTDGLFRYALRAGDGADGEQRVILGDPAVFAEAPVVSAVSFTGAGHLRQALAELKISSGIIMTQVVPPLDSALPIMEEARRKLGDAFGWVTLEGYIVGRMWLKAMTDAGSALSRNSALAALRGKKFNLGGLLMDFTDDNQGSDLVVLTHLTENGFEPMPNSQWDRLLAR